MLQVTFCGSKYILSHFISLLGNIFLKYKWEISTFSIFDTKNEHNPSAFNLFIGIIKLFCMMWWSLIVREPLFLTLFWTMIFYAFGRALDWLVVTLENKMLLKLYFTLKKGHYMHIYIQKGIPREANK